MQYGHFDDDAREYVIDRPDTPRSWSNYLGSVEYGAIITNNAGGYSFFRSAADARFTRLRFNSIPTDQPGRYFYIRDRESGEYWSASWQPVGKPLDRFKTTCRHGTAYTVIESEYGGIASEATYFVPLDQQFEYWMLRLTNRGGRARKLSVFTYVEFANEWNAFQDLFNLQFSQHIVKSEVAGATITTTTLNDTPLPRVGREVSLSSFITAVGADVVGFDTDREAFIGPYRGYGNPVAVEAGRCTGSLADGDNACGVLQMDLTLAPGEAGDILVMLGLGKGDDEGRAVVQDFGTIEKATQKLDKLKAYWHGRLGKLLVHTPDGEFDSMVNVWNAYNCLITYAWSRSASLIYSGERNGLGYRDTVQDILAVLPAIPDEAGKRLELMLTGQYSSGGAMPVVQPFEHTPGEQTLPGKYDYRSDDCLWLFNTIPAYVKETGDMGFYEKALPYADAGQATVLGHMKRAIEFNLQRVGKNGLPCGLDADWNDCLHLGPKGESIFVTFQVRLALDVYRDICRRLHRPDEADWAGKTLADLDARIQAVAWDGQWFVRGIFEDGYLAGSRQSDEGMIFVNAQSWSVISGAAAPDQAVRAMDAVHEHLATEYGIMVTTPPYKKTDRKYAGASVCNAGQKENGGIFCHTQGWAVMAETILGRGDRAYEYYRAYMPAAYNSRAEVRQIEPYVHCQSTHGRHSRKFGASRLPWLSGTASWSYVAATQYILGVQPDYDGLRIDPCLPSAWDRIGLTRIFRGKRFDITITNGPNGKGVEKLTVNGAPVEGSLIPADLFRQENRVEVHLR